MKEKKNKIIWLFLFLSLILFARVFLSLLNVKNFSLDPFKANKYDNYSSLLANNPSIEEKLIAWMISLNKEDSDAYLFAGDYFQKKGDLTKAADFYQKAINMAPLLNFDIYRKQLKVYESLNKDKETEDLLLSIFKKVEEMGYYPSFTFNLSKELYLAGERSLEKGDWQKTVFWWEKIIKIFPDYSYFHLDLASLYYQEGQPEKAKETLENCLKKKEAKEHCQEYLDSGMIQFKIEKPRFWKEEILKISELNNP